MVTLAWILLTGGDGSPVKSKQFTKAELPFERITGISIKDSKWVVASMRGLSIGAPGSTWENVNKRAVRRMVSDPLFTWVLYGDGGVDKLDVASDRLYYDVFQGAVKRPWVSSISVEKGGLVFGGLGGWFVKNGNMPIRQSYPDVLKGKQVLCVEAVGSEKLVGTQDGLFVVDAKATKRLGFGAGLGDTWITSIVTLDGSVLVGTYTGGLYSYRGSKLTKVDTPSQKVVSLSVWKGNLVLGGLDGSWLRTGSKWQNLTQGETTFLQPLSKSFFVGTPACVTKFD